MTATESLIVAAVFLAIGTYLIGYMVGHNSVASVREEAERQIANGKRMQESADDLVRLALDYKRSAEGLVRKAEGHREYVDYMVQAWRKEAPNV